jgi:fructokinase
LLGLPYADILKISENELMLMTAETNLEKGSGKLFESGVKLVVVTLGSKGCYYKYKGGAGLVATYDTKIVDTTGAGDAFLGGLLYSISRLNTSIENLEKSQMEEIVDFSNTAGALCASRRDGIPAIPM